MLFGKQYLLSYCWVEKAFIYRWRNINGIDNHWEYLRPSQVSAYLLDDGSGLIYNITFDEPKIGVKMNVPQNDILHFRLLSKTVV